MLKEHLEYMEIEARNLKDECATMYRRMMYRRMMICGDTSINITYNMRRSQLGNLLMDIEIVKSMIENET